jgi:hypothetical protein
VRRGFAGPQVAAGLDNLADGQFGEQSDGQDDPEDDLAGQAAASGIETLGILQGLPYIARSDNLLLKEQSVQDWSGLTGGQQT